MRIGILTFHAADNYGAVLQAYALQEYLTGLGHSVEIIDYRPEYLINGYRICPKSRYKGIKGVIRTLGREIFNFIKMGHCHYLKILKKRAFANFRAKYLNLSKNIFRGVVDNDMNYDAVFFGSDQIWSMRHTGGGDILFMGGFPSQKGTLKIAYAASAGKYFEVLLNCKTFLDNVNNFDSLSVRELDLYNAVKTVYKGEPEVVVDPTLLAPEGIWAPFIGKPIIPRGYVLIYEVIENSRINDFANKLAKELGVEIIRIWDGYKLSWRKYTLNMGPDAFVNLIKYARCVLTTSFHAVAFSLIFKKDFYFLSNKEPAENRITSILTYLNLMDRYTENVKTSFTPIDWNSVGFDEKIAKLRSQSANFIDNSLRR